MSLFIAKDGRDRQPNIQLCKHLWNVIIVLCPRANIHPREVEDSPSFIVSQFHRITLNQPRELLFSVQVLSPTDERIPGNGANQRAFVTSREASFSSVSQMFPRHCKTKLCTLLEQPEPDPEPACALQF